MAMSHFSPGSSTPLPQGSPGGESMGGGASIGGGGGASVGGGASMGGGASIGVTGTSTAGLASMTAGGESIVGSGTSTAGLAWTASGASMVTPVDSLPHARRAQDNPAKTTPRRMTVPLCFGRLYPAILAAMYKKVLVGADLTPASEPAVRAALELAKILGAHVTALHVLDAPLESTKWFLPDSPEMQSLRAAIAREENTIHA